MAIQMWVRLVCCRDRHDGLFGHLRCAERGRGDTSREHRG